MKPGVTRLTLLGVFLTSLSTLLFETLLTRIFSVTMWYHFAFAAVSMALFGMTVGSVLVYLFPRFFDPARIRLRLVQSAVLFSLAIILSFMTHLSIPIVTTPSIMGVYTIASNYVVLSFSFIFSGITISLALTTFKQGVSRLYAADLVGSALGCIVLIYSLQLTDGPSAVIIAAALAGCSALVFSFEAGRKKLTMLAAGLTLFLAIGAAFNAFLAARQLAPLDLLWVKGELEPTSLYEKWNSFSRIRVMGDPDVPREPDGWGLAPRFNGSENELVQLGMDIDANAYTVLTAFDGRLEPLEFLKYDVTNVVHYIRHDADVLVVGVGGGRDLLSALVFKQKSVLGVEINKNIVDLISNNFADLTGHLLDYPQIKVVVDEARSLITRTPERFDVIQVSLIDTWAATGSGAFALTENSLYTVEAWKLFMERLNPGGVLSFSRWYLYDAPAEMVRLTSLASESLQKSGFENPRDHIVIICSCTGSIAVNNDRGVATLLASNRPFTARDLDELERVAREMGFEIILSPRTSVDATFGAIASGEDYKKFPELSQLDLSAPTDDRPFFFLTMPLLQAFNPANWFQGYNLLDAVYTNRRAVMVLLSLLITVIALSLLAILIPLRLTTDRKFLKGSSFAFVYFAAIGLAFMLVEISQMQRLVIFLGHPTYSLSVVLFTLLLGSGLGSATTQSIRPERALQKGRVRLACLLAALILFGLVTPYVIRGLAGAATPVRILATIGLLFPPGVFMGMAFPLGMKLAGLRPGNITPWLWGINGAMSVCASVLAVFIAVAAGFSVAFWSGIVCYGVALLAFSRVHLGGSKSMDGNGSGLAPSLDG